MVPTHAGSLVLLTLLSASYAQAEGFLTRPDIYGDRVVFTAEGDLWLGSIASGEAWRITSAPGVETASRFSPDGQSIAFTADYDGGRDVYVMPTEGGVPKRLTYDPSEEELPGATVLGWTPDGKRVIFSSSGHLCAPPFEQHATQELFSVPVTGGPPSRLPVPRATFADLSDDGNTLAYVPSSNAWMNWFRYEGGGADQIWLTDLRKGTFKRLIASKGVETQPAWLGSKLYYVSERSGTRNLWCFDPKTQKSAPITSLIEAPVRFPASDGKRIVYQIGPRLGIYDPAFGTRPLSIRLHSDRIHARPFEVPTYGSDGQSKESRKGQAISPKADRIALATRGHLVTVSTEGDRMHTLVGGSTQHVHDPAWSPDGRQIAYVSDASGEEELYLGTDEDGAVPRRLTRSLTGQHGRPQWSIDAKYLLLGNRTGGIQLVDTASGEVKTIAQNDGENAAFTIQGDFSFSPDGKWIAYSIYRGKRVSTVCLYEIATGRTTPVTHPDIDSSCPAFSSDGRYLFVLQQRSAYQEWSFPSLRLHTGFKGLVTGYCLAAETKPPAGDEKSVAIDPPVKVDLEGLPSRSFELGVPPGTYTQLIAVPGWLLLQSDRTIFACDLATRNVKPLAENVQLLDRSPDGKKLLVEGDGALRVVGTDDGSNIPLKLDGLTVTVDPIAEWRQIFEEAWRISRDFFYDPSMHGVDWKAIHRRYEAQLPLVGSRHDLLRLIRDMVSELNTGHSFSGGWPIFNGKTARPAVLGVDLEWDPAGGAYRIRRILRGDAWDLNARSPFAAPGVNVRKGDYLLKIGGKALRADQDPAALLVGMAGRTIEVTVNSAPVATGARTLEVKPLASDRELRTKAWIEERRAYVEKASGGLIAYVNLGDMGSRGAAQFAGQYYPNVDKPGIIVDVRGNDGGNISGNVLNDLASRVTGFFAYRAGGNYRREGWAPLGQIVALTNEWAFSDADYFSEFFKRMKIGTLVGHRTTGGVVGPVIYRFMDGSGIGVPNYGAWVPGEWIVEGRGAVPDVEIDQDPAALMAGRDPQLEKAVEVLLAQLKANPFKMPPHPAYPKKPRGSRGD